MQSGKQITLLILSMWLASLACGSLTQANPGAISPTSASPGARLTPTVGQSEAEAPPSQAETNPPPDTLPAPDTTPQPAQVPQHHPGDPIHLDEIHMFSLDKGWAISQADVLVTSDGAQTWREVTPPETLPSGSKIQAQGTFLDPLNAWIVFSIDDQVPPEAVVWHTKDGGQTWTASVPLDHQVNGQNVWAQFSPLDATHLWLIMRAVFVGAGTHYVSQFFRTNDGGLTWLPLAGDVGVDYTGLVFIGPLNGWLTWQSTGAYAPGPPEYAVTSDGAVNWDSRELPPPPDAPDLFNTLPYCEDYQPQMLSANSIRLLVDCFDYFDPPHVFSSYLYSSDDAGSTWISTRLPDKVQASQDMLLFFDSQNVLLLGRDMYRTTDGGQDWTYVKSVNWDGQFSFIDPLTGWAVARAGDQLALVKTVNGGSSWTEVRPVIAP